MGAGLELCEFCAKTGGIGALKVGMWRLHPSKTDVYPNCVSRSISHHHEIYRLSLEVIQHTPDFWKTHLGVSVEREIWIKDSPGGVLSMCQVTVKN